MGSVFIILLLLLVLLAIIAAPIRLRWKLVLNFGCGLLCLLLLNLLAPYTGMLFDLNVVTVVTVGFLGLPGIGLLMAVHLILSL